MRVLSLAIAVALFSAVVCQSVVYSSYTKPAINKFCRRNVVVANNALLNTITAQSNLGCVSISNASMANGRYGALGFQLSGALLPSFGIYGYGISGQGGAGGSSGGAYLFGSRFAVDTIVEYNETNGKAGYQPTGTNPDKTIATYTMADLFRVNKWSALNLQTSNIDANTKVHKITTSLKGGDLGGNAHTVTWGAMITTDEVIAGDTTKVVLTPNSFKTIFDLQNFQYKSTDTRTRIAIGTVLISAGATTKWSSTPKSKDGDRPNEVTSNQGVYGIGGTDSSSNPNGYFSYQKFITTTDGATVSGSTRVVTLVNDDFTAETDANIQKNSDEATLSFKRVWFGIQDRVTNFNWDPSLGSNEAQENQVPQTNAAASLSMLIALLSFVVALML